AAARPAPWLAPAGRRGAAAAVAARDRRHGDCVSRLLDPRLGEIVDRLTILGLKTLHGRQAGKPVAHFETEMQALVARFAGMGPMLGPLEVTELAAVNGALWQAEDDLRELRANGVEQSTLVDAGRLAFRMQQLNDER